MEVYIMNLYFDDFDPDDPYSPTERQQAFMTRHEIVPEGPIDRSGAWERINGFIQSRRRLGATPFQKEFLRMRDLWRHGMSRGEAFDLIAQIKREEGDFSDEC
jgi:hypothetical protein